MTANKILYPNKQRVLLCDAGFSSIPILQALQSRGYWVAVCGGRPEDPGHFLANASFNFDYSSIEDLQQHVEQNNIQFLVPGCTDISYSSCSLVATNLGLPGYDDPAKAKLISDKNQFRNLSKTNHYPIPAFTSEIGSFESLNFPALLKPIDSFSGRGIKFFENAKQWQIFLEQQRFSLSNGKWILEEFIDGALFSHSAFLQNGKIIQDFFVREFCTVYPYQVNSSYVCSDPGIKIAQQMRDWVGSIAKDISLTDGLLHTQFISKDANVYLIESCRRCPGDLYSLLIHKSTGFDYANWFSMPFTSEDYPTANSLTSESVPHWVSRHTASSLQEGQLEAVSLKGDYADIEYHPIKRLGQEVQAAPMDRAGIFFLSHASEQLMKGLTPSLVDQVQLHFLKDIAI